ncbi:GAF domain-containing protein [Deinococcus koreensis]|uniref:histidine kinase n=1 Tax=Deinococcus koreensis TaxID=2054903 RepID=A0A2K3V0K5_9DEIO|nr:GAF domain-containing protein [Deinococcus koreensis]PNY82315.1 histidine kinase [Deinococcus koreensis]
MSDLSVSPDGARPDPELWFHTLTDTLACARSVADLQAAGLGPALQALGIGAASAVWVPCPEASSPADQPGDGERPTLVPLSAGPLTLLNLTGTGAGTPVEVALNGEALYFPDAGALGQTSPERGGQVGGVASAAVLPLWLGGVILGALALEFPAPEDFAPPRRRQLQTLAALLAQGLARVLGDQPGPQPGGRTDRAGSPQDSGAQDAFVAFTEAVGTQTDMHSLTRQAVGALLAQFGDAEAAYFVRRDGLFTLFAWTPDMEQDAELLSTLRAGLPLDTPIFAQSLQTMQPVFVDHWDAQAGQVAQSGAFASAATAPIVLDGEVRGMLSAGLRRSGGWTARDRAVFQAVARSLRLALERADITAQLEARNTELAARTGALESFAELTRDLNLLGDPAALVRRAQEVAVSLIPSGFAMYYELEDQVWHLKSQVGAPADPALGALLSTPLPYAQARDFQLPWDSGQPFYTDAGNAGRDTRLPGTEGLECSAILPVLVGTQRQGMFGYGLDGRRLWSAADRAVLESVVRSLGLALERTLQTRRLREERAALEAFTVFTEAAGVQTDVLGLSHQAFEVLRARFSDTSTSVYYQLEEDRLVARSWSPDIEDQPELLAVLRAGLPLDTPLFAEAIRSGEATFTERWDSARQQIAHTEAYGAAAVYPLRVQGRLFAFMGLGLRSSRNWTEQDAAVLRAVGRGLTLALERAAVVAQLAQRTRELEHSNAELEQFAYVASHDLQEPLRSVTSFAQLLASRYQGHPDGPQDERVQTYVQVITEGTSRMAQLIQDLLAFSRVATSEAPFVTVQTGQVVARVMQDLSAQQERTQAQVRVAELPDVLGDPSQLRQLFQNLIGNALKFTAPGRPPVVQVRAEAQGGLIRFSVSDNGIGIEPQHHERIFGIFQRLHARDVYEGSGIGLSIARKIVERHRGHLGLSSSGVGTTFSFTLPAAPDSEAAPPASA